MFLKMLAASEENGWDDSLAKAAAKLLVIVSIADQEDNDDAQDMAPFKADSFGFGYFSDEIQDYFKKRPGGEWFISKKEQIIIEEYSKELGVWNDGGLFSSVMRAKGLESQGAVFTPTALEKALEELTSTTSRISFDDRRKIMIKHAVADAINSVEEPISVQFRKCILFECLAVAYVDSDYSEMEQYTVNCIVEKFQLEQELVDEMIDYINQYMSLYGEIYELITE